MVHGMVSRIYSDNIVELEPIGTTYDEWFSSRNINVAELNQDDMNVLYQDLVKTATGMELNDKTSLRDLQAAMVKMLSQLSSYSVQFVTEINATDIQKTDTPAVRVGDVDNSTSAERFISNIGAEVQHVRGSTAQELEVLPMGSHVVGVFHGLTAATARLSILPGPKFDPMAMTSHVRVDPAPIRVKLHTPLKPNTAGVVPVPGIDDWLALPFLQQQNQVDVYNGGYSTLPFEDIDPDAGDVDMTLYMMPKYVAPNYSF
jgi:hypothetical protein